MSFFLVLDSKGREFEEPKARPTHDKYQNHFSKKIQVVLNGGEFDFGRWSKKGRK
jgi:hypothetical protein